MATPSFNQWRRNSSPITTGATINLPVQTVVERQLACLATIVTQTNPDGTAVGT